MGNNCREGLVRGEKIDPGESEWRLGGGGGEREQLVVKETL